MDQEARKANEAGIRSAANSTSRFLDVWRVPPTALAQADANVHGSNQAGVIQELSAPMALSLQANSVLTAVARRS